MATPKELRAGLSEARAELAAALHEAHGKWTVEPSHGEGEEAWSPQKVAGHVIGAELYFASLVSEGCGYGPRQMERPDVETPAAAAASLVRFAAKADGVIQHVTQEDLAKTYKHDRFGELTVERMLEMVTGHIKDHANQIRQASK